LYGQNPYRGFESHLLRHPADNVEVVLLTNGLPLTHTVKVTEGLFPFCFHFIGIRAVLPSFQDPQNLLRGVIRRELRIMPLSGGHAGVS